MTEGPGHRTVLAFMPDHPEDGVGSLARVRSSEGPPDAPPPDELEDCLLCPGCCRPVYESSASHALVGAGPMPLFGLCKLCAEGTTLRSLRQTDVPVDPQQHAVLETVAAAMA
ncbi:hypothetical protein [Streptomyces spectabilis]|uniref:Uncharacterized protein n=1 Tax=Streptomyces spectabilis TaxID=68270 RepID=A0A7W8B5C8_STRST|nr:hypothetical protein [Streptomyces spectabilis]MBB5109147.1 hypothetical protein [Streptomyces spectabilis]MCI3907709.1 hypothetical protein [Streptomyces spectabilis]